MTGDLTTHQLNQWRGTVEARLRVDGDLRVTTSPDRPGFHEFEVIVPGWGLPPVARLVHREWYVDRAAGVWRLDRYTYHLASYFRGGAFGFHWHELAGPHRGTGNVYHTVCTPAPPGRKGHFRAHRMELLEGHEALMRLVASDQPIVCSGLYRL